MKENNLIPPKKDFANKFHEYFNESAKTITGGFINPLIDFVLPSLHQKKIEEWCENVYHAIIELNEKKLTKEDLAENEEFISLLKECIIIASKTHQIEKHELLKRVVLNHFESPVPFDAKLLFARLLDSLTLSHLTLFRLIDRYFNEIKEIKDFSKIEKIFESDPLSNAIPDNSYRMLLHDLENMNLIATGDIVFEVRVRQAFGLSAGGENPKLPYITVTKFGKDFIEYLMMN